MFELPEYLVLASQIEKSLRGEVVRRAVIGECSHKFVWYNRSPADFDRLTRGRKVGKPVVRGRWMSVPLEPGYVLLLGECGGSLRREAPGVLPPDKRHLLVEFEDGSLLWARTAMWGAYELYEEGRELERQYVKDQRPSPLDRRFTAAYLDRLVSSLAAEGKRSAKSLLVQDQLIPGLGNSIAQDILFEARIGPRRDIATLSKDERRALRDAIVGKVREIAAAGGREDETDLYGRPGGYARIMGSAAPKEPCPRCGGTVSSGQYLGGAIYWCPACQA